MACEQFEPKVFTLAHRVEIRRANEIISEYAAQGFMTLTVRSIYYRFVARDYIPNTLRSYKRLADILNCARLAGEIDWDSIGDNIRNLDTPASWRTGVDMMDAAAEAFRHDPWEPTDTRIEVWPEKDAITGFVEPVCRRFRVPLFACRGFTSQSEAYAAGRRIRRYLAQGKRVLILHIGDHDPSGIDMTRDNERRLRMLGRVDEDDDFEFRRIALNMDQIRQYEPPENPAKTGDSRIDAYRALMEDYGYDDPDDLPSWELDALSPTVLDEIITSHIQPEVDQKIWDRVIAEEETVRGQLADVRDNWKAAIQRPWSKRTPEEIRTEAAEIAYAHDHGDTAHEIEQIEINRQ